MMDDIQRLAGQVSVMPSQDGIVQIGRAHV